MNLFIYSILVLMSIALVVLIIKEHLDYKKEFKDSLNKKYDSRLKNEVELYND